MTRAHVTRLDLRGFRCPLVVRLVARAVGGSPVPDRLEVVGDDPAMALDLRAWADAAGWSFERIRNETAIEVVLSRHGPPSTLDLAALPDG